MSKDWYGYEEKLLSAEFMIKKCVSSEKNKELIFSFEKELVVQGISKPRIIRYLFCLKKLDGLLGKDFDRVTKEDLFSVVSVIEKQDLSVWTKHSDKVILKRFFKWVYGCGEGYPDVVRWIKSHVKKSRDKLPNDGEMLSEDEVRRLVEKVFNLRDKALVSLLWETGCRIGEIATLRIRSVKFDEYGAVLSVNGKTGPRSVRVINSTSYLANWINTHPSVENRDAPLWVNIGQRNHGKMLEYASIRKMLKIIFGRAGVKKRCNPHSFRHARATFLANHLTEFQMNQYFGWVQGSDMPSTYVHLSGKDIDGALLRLNGIKVDEKAQESVLKARKCPRCGFLNAYDHKFCSRCGGVFDVGELVKVQEEARLIEKKRAFSDAVMSKLFEDSEFQAFVKSKLVKFELSTEDS